MRTILATALPSCCPAALSIIEARRVGGHQYQEEAGLAMQDNAWGVGSPVSRGRDL